MANERIIDLPAITGPVDTDIYECSHNGTLSTKETRLQMRTNMQTNFDGVYKALPVPRNYTNLSNQPLPYSFTNTTGRDLFFIIYTFLVVNPGQSTSINIAVNGLVVNQVTLTTPITYPDPQQQTNPASVIVPIGGTLNVTLVGQAQILGPAILYITL